MAAGTQPALAYSAPRRFPRYKLNVPLRVVIPRPSATTIVTGRGNEISEGGMAIFAGIEVRLGEELAVEFTPPYGSGPIRVRAAIRNRKGYTYGIEFLADSPEELEQVDRLRELLRFASGSQPV